MKKENRRLAQQRRAAQRKKQAMYRMNPDLAGQEAVFTVTVNGIYTG